MKKDTKKIIIVGGGFAGINLIKRLSGDDDFHITLVDKNNYNFFPPLLYQVAAAFIEPSNISYPFRRMFQKKKNLRFHLGTLVRINTKENTIETDTGTLDYDYLVLAVGTESNYFGMENVKKYALPMKTINDALSLRNHLLLNMEKAVRTYDILQNEKSLNIVIAGGGPTGVEVAGMLAEMGHYLAAKEYPETNLQSHIYLVDPAPVLLGTMSKSAQRESERILKKLGVHVKLNVGVKDYTNGRVALSNGETIPTDTLIWASGVTGRELPGLPSDAIAKKGRRVIVNEYNLVKGSKNIFAIGDIAIQASDKNYPDGHPQLAQVAIQHGTNLAKNFKRILSNRTPIPFKYNNKGSMAIISKYKAIVDLPGFSLKGFIAWLIWLFIHIIPIAGFRNKIKIAFNWLWAFISNNPTLRLIIGLPKDK